MTDSPTSPMSEQPEEITAFVEYGELRSYDHIAKMERVFGDGLVSAEEVRDGQGFLKGWTIRVSALRTQLEEARADHRTKANLFERQYQQALHDHAMMRDARDALRTQLEEVRATLMVIREQQKADFDRASAAEARIERLEEALRQARGQIAAAIAEGSTSANSLPHIAKIARTALAQPKGEADVG